MFSSIAYYIFLGLPMIAWGGIVSFFFLFSTVFIAFLHKKGNFTIPYKYHPIFGFITLILASFHGLLGILAYLGY